MKIACLHTAESNIAVFEKAARTLGLPANVISHVVRPDLLISAEQAGGLTPAVADATAELLRKLGQSADAVILTCSTLGPAVNGLEHTAPVPIFRVDAALANQAVAFGGKVIVLCAVQTTLEPTQRLFAENLGVSQCAYEVHLVPGAWALFKSGDLKAYISTIANAAEDAYRQGASIVALAQASMADAADFVCQGPKPLTSPSAGLAAAVSALRSI